MAEVQASGPLNLLRPLILIGYTLSYLPITILSLVRESKLSVLFSPSDFKDHWFARFWTFFGPKSRAFAAQSVQPLLAQNARGVCVDIGPGTGQWLDLLAAAQNPSITKIYGVEPNLSLHPELRASITRAGLDGVYEILGCGAEELGSKGGMQPGSIDTVITVQCLCSIPTPEKVIKEIYPFLKPGGRWLVYEHVKTKYQGDFVGYWQKVLNIVWPHCFNGCDITRPTDEWLLRAGDWEEVALKPGAGENQYDTVPHVIGTLTKRR